MDYENDPGWQYLRRSREQMIEASMVHGNFNYKSLGAFEKIYKIH